jgi:BASS family bile acid:Na+ symporter
LGPGAAGAPDWSCSSRGVIEGMAVLVLLALKVAVMVTVFALGLSVGPGSAVYLLRRPGLLLRSLLAMNVIVPLFVTAMVVVFHLRPAVEIALISLAVSPVPPTLPARTLKAGGGAPYAIGLLATAALLAIVFVPLAVGLLGRAVGLSGRVPPAPVAATVAMTVLAPLAAGVLVHRFAPTLAARLARPVSLLGSVLLAVGPAIIPLMGNGTLAAIVAFILVGLAVGHALGGPEPADRTVLALMTASRHPGVAITIASASFPERKPLIAAMVLYLLVNVILYLPYRAWCRRRQTGGGEHRPDRDSGMSADDGPGD